MRKIQVALDIQKTLSEIQAILVSERETAKTEMLRDLLAQAATKISEARGLIIIFEKGSEK